MLLKPGTTLHNNSYRIIQTLGRGGFGVTYLAEQIMTRREVCIKEFFPKDYYKREGDSSAITLSSDGFAEAMNRFKAKFIKEAQTIAALDHPNIIHIHEAFEENGTAYYVMEYIDGESLNDTIKRSGAMAESEAVAYINQVASALEYIHNQQIMHLDVKPGNIMVRSKDNRTILIDFGLSKHYDTASGEATSTTPVGVSHGFAPMEQYNPGGVSTFSPETDIYSLGATLYYLVTGNIPPSATDISEDGLPALPSHLSTGVRTAIERSMEDKRKNRPHSISAFIALLHRNEDTIINANNVCDKTKIASTPTPMHTTQDSISPVHRPKRRWWIWLLVVLILLIAFVVFYKDSDAEKKSVEMVEETTVYKEDNETEATEQIQMAEATAEYPKQSASVDSYAERTVTPITISPKQQKEERIKELLTSFYEYTENNDFYNLQYLYASKVDRFYSLYNTNRGEVMDNWKQYDDMFKVIPNSKQYLIDWNTLKITEDYNNTFVEYELIFSMKRYEPNKPSWFHLKVHMKLNANYEIVSIYEDTLEKR